MTIRVAVNGYGRIGRCATRALYESGYRDSIEIAALNEKADLSVIAHLTKYDTTHGRFPGQVSTEGSDLVINGDSIRVLQSEDISRLPWKDLDIDVVLECTGSFSDRATAEKHLEQGASKVIFSQPAEPDVDATIVFGINDHTLTGSEQIISNASCTTNCIIPVLHVLDSATGITQGTVTTIHSAMNDQPVIDAYHHVCDMRRTRSAFQSIIPVETRLPAGIGRIMPHLEGLFQAQALRVPTVNVSAMDITMLMNEDTDKCSINKLLREAAEGGLSGILGYTDDPLTSSDFNHDTRSAIVDGSQTRVSGTRLVTVLAWFDNEWGYANRMLDTTIACMGK